MDSPGTAQAAQVAQDDRAGLNQAIRKGFSDFVEKHKLPGLALAVMVDGEIVVEQQIGVRDFDSNEPITRDTLFRVGSVSKLVTSVGLVLLARDGKIDLDAPVTKYIPDLPEHYNDVTTRMLAGHLGGVRHYRDEVAENLITKQYKSMKEVLPVFVNDPLSHQPGSAYNYSSYGFTLIGAVMESVIEESLAEFLRQQVLEPLDLNETFAENWERPTLPLATGYTTYQGKLLTPEVNHSGKLATGGYLSTPADLVKFLDRVTNRELLKDSDRELLFTRQRTSDGKEIKVGLGWVVDKDEQGRTYVHKGGQIIGGRTIVVTYPAEGVSVAICCNETFGPFGIGDALKIAALFLPKDD